MRSDLHRLCPPPRRFRPAGNVVEAEFASRPPFTINKRTRNKARADGIRYERKAHAYITEKWSDECVIAPWIKFTSQNSPKSRGRTLWCQPDALIVDLRRGEITVIEIKLKHTSDAWWQVRRLYTPVVKHIFGEHWTYRALEITKWFDADTKFPERFDFLDTLSELPQREASKFLVHIWSGKAR